MKKMRITAATARGNTHVFKNLPCQDARKCFHLEDGKEIIAVADGHGCMRAHPFSKDGASLAVEAFCKVAAAYLKEWKSERLLKDFLAAFGKEIFANEVQTEWKKSVARLHSEKRRCCSSGRDVFTLYGTTLMGMIILDSWSFVFQIGDGDIMLVSPEKAVPLMEDEWIPGDETWSLCQPDVWKKTKTRILEHSETEYSVAEHSVTGHSIIALPYMYWLSTDGFSNSFPTDEEFYQTLIEYCRFIEDYGFKKLKVCLKEYLQETSIEGCGDDITVAIGYMEG